MKDSKQIEEILRSIPGFEDCSATDISEPIGDASGRRYFRLALTNHKLPSLFYVELAGTKGPLFSVHPPDSALHDLNQDDFFLAAAALLKGNEIRVPQVYFADLKKGAMLIEDLGTVTLRNILFEGSAEEKRQIFTRASDTIILIQQIQPDARALAFKKFYNEEDLLREALRFIEFYLPSIGGSKAIEDVASRCLKQLCQQISRHPQTVMHRDFMCDNIMVLPENQLAIIDFQDLLVGPDSYDLSTLLHDRDTDLQLGDNLINQIIHHTIAKDKTGKGPESFKLRYAECILQRSFRLSGQFLNLSRNLNKPHYAAWIPGSLTRIGRFIGRVDYLRDFATILANEIPEVAAGLAAPFCFEDSVK